MGNALDAFRAQREAAEQLQAQLSVVSAGLATLQQQIAALALNDELKALLRDEQRWLAQAQHTIGEVRRWREREMRAFGWPLVWRWVVACAFALESAALDGAGRHPETVAARLRYTAPFDMSGHPTLTLPGGMTSNGVPVGFQIVARAFGEADVLAAGHAYQKATDWHLKRPPI